MLCQVRKKPDEELLDLSGQIICKKYKLKNQAGSGAHGVVYLGKDISSNLPVAVKVVILFVSLYY